MQKYSSNVRVNVRPSEPTPQSEMSTTTILSLTQSELAMSSGQQTVVSLKKFLFKKCKVMIGYSAEMIMIHRSVHLKYFPIGNYSST